MTSKIVRSNGTTVLTGIKSCIYVETVNAGDGIRPGCVASSYIDVEVYGSQSSAPASGEALTYYQVDANGTEKLIGIFYAEASIPAKNTYRFTAYDAVAKLDVSFSERLNDIQDGFPMTVYDIVSEACTVAGVSLGSASWPLSTQTVQAFYADGITCRNILQYAAEIAGRFVRCDSSGNIIFDWYTTNSSYSIHPGSSQSGEVPYKQDGLNYDNYSVLAVNAVAIRPSGTEGAAYIYPSSYGSITATDPNGDGNVILTNISVTDNGGGNMTLSADAEDDGNGNLEISDSASAANTLIIGDNLLLTNATDAIYNAAAENIYDVMSALPTYRHSTIRLFSFLNPFRAGEFVSVTDVQGVSFVTPIFTMTVQSEAATIQSSGTQTYATDTGSSVDKALKNLAANIVQIEKLKVSWADIQEAIVEYLKLYGTMTVYTDSSLETEGGKLGYTTGNSDMPVAVGMILASALLKGVTIVSDNGSYIAFKGHSDYTVDYHMDGGEIVISDILYGRRVGLTDSGTDIQGGARLEQDDLPPEGEIPLAYPHVPEGDVTIMPGGNGEVTVAGFQLASSSQTVTGSGDVGDPITLTESVERNWVYPSELEEVDEKIGIRTYSSVTALGLTSGSATIADVYSELSANTRLVAAAEQFASGETPHTYGTVEIVKAGGDSRGWVAFHGKGIANGEYRMGLDGTNEPDGVWCRIPTSPNATPYGMYERTTHTVVSAAAITAGSYISGTVTFAKSGYYPLSIAGWDASGTGSTYVIPMRLFISSASSGSVTVGYLIRNYSTTADVTSATVTVDILWAATS